MYHIIIIYIYICRTARREEPRPARLCLRHSCLPFRPLPYLTWPMTCGSSTGLSDPTLPRQAPALLPFQKQSPARLGRGVTGSS